MPNFTIPNKIHVGYQKRSDTFSDKLGFITYKDDSNIMRFEKSWEGWRDKTINTDEFDNSPTEGFVLNKNSGRQWGNFERAEFVRIFDPRGFEFEISTDNLMQIILHNGISKGNGVEGKCVYAWDYGKKKLTLLPVDCEDYKKTEAFKSQINSGNSVKFEKSMKLVPGMRYKTKPGFIVTYLGKFSIVYEYYPWNNTANKYTNEHIFHIDDIFKKYDHLSNYLKSTTTFITHVLEPNDTFNEMLLDFHESPFISQMTPALEKEYKKAHKDTHDCRYMFNYNK